MFIDYITGISRTPFKDEVLEKYAKEIQKICVERKLEVILLKEFKRHEKQS